MAKSKKTQESLEDVLWKSADKLRKNIDAAEYKHIVWGLSFCDISLMDLKNIIKHSCKARLKKRKTKMNI